MSATDSLMLRGYARARGASRSHVKHGVKSPVYLYESMLRPLILTLAKSGMAERFVTSTPVVRGISRRFVAGYEQRDVIEAVRRLNERGFEATVSLLGEEVTDAAAAEADVREFEAYIDAVARGGLRSHVSVKLTQLGLSFDRELALRSLTRVLECAQRAGTFVRVDMEDSRYTQPTLDIVRKARRSHDNVGAVIQAYLHRSEGDIEALATEGVPVRIVKGAYREPAAVALQQKRDVDAAYVRLVERYMQRAAPGAWLAVATHDERMIAAALKAAARHAFGRERLEFQMLYGIRVDLQRRLLGEGQRVRVYVPYGSHWYPYLMRRLAERPANLWFFLRGAIGR